MSSTNATEHKTRSASRPMTEWLEKAYDAPRQEHDGPEALAWDDHGLRAANQRPPAQV